MSKHEFVPYLSVNGAEKAVAFYSQVFDVEPFVVLKMPDGRVMHCEFRLGESKLFLSEELPEHGGTPSPGNLGATTVAIHVYVEDCDELTEAMRKNGATVLMEPSDVFWGERFARVRDPFGHEWGLATRIKEMSADEISEAADKMFEEM